MEICGYVFFVKQKTAYEVRISDWSSDVCSSDLLHVGRVAARQLANPGVRTGRDPHRGLEPGGVPAPPPTSDRGLTLRLGDRSHDLRLRERGAFEELASEGARPVRINLPARQQDALLPQVAVCAPGVRVASVPVY